MTAPPFRIACPTAIHFGAGTADNIAAVLPKTDGAIVLVRGASGAASASVSAQVHRTAAPIVEIAVRGEPSVADINAARAACAGHRIGALVACGGGSVIDTGKALCFCLSHGIDLPDDFGGIDPARLATPSHLPLVALPTTAGTGAEVTANAVLSTGRGAKTSLRGRALYPSVAIVDPTLLRGAPKHVVLSAGLDAVTQSIEAYTSCLANPFTDALTAPNVTTGLRALKAVIEAPDDTAWTNIAWTSLSSGLALANGGLGAAHGLAAVLGGGYDAPHGALCGRLLAPVLRENQNCAPAGSDALHKITKAMTAIADTFPPVSPDDPLSGFSAWIDAHGLPHLGAYDIERSAFDDLATASVTASSSTKNAVPLDQPSFLRILDAAY
ncbi:MAG: iron-containing alcohol dehydrogenase [Pseudomonadota bacterium]